MRRRPADEPRHQQPHGAGSVDEIAGAGCPRQPIEAVNRTRHRLDEPGELDRHVFRESVGAGLGHDDHLGESARLGHADGAVVRAEVLASDVAVVAPTAGQIRIDRYVIPDIYCLGLLADRDDFAGELMPGNERIDSRCQLTVEDVHVGPAQTAHADFHDDLRRPRRRVGDLGNRPGAGFVDLYRAHGHRPFGPRDLSTLRWESGACGAAGQYFGHMYTSTRSHEQGGGT